MKVIWNGTESSLKNINDPVIQPRLKQILDAHERLWGISIIASRNLNEGQRDLLRRACHLNFKCGKEDLEQRRQEYYQAIVKASVLSSEQSLGTPAQHEESLRGAAAELFAVKTDKRPFRTRLNDAIRKHFRRPSAADGAGTPVQ